MDKARKGRKNKKAREKPSPFKILRSKL